MFGLSASKLLLLALVIAAVWYGYKHLARPDSAGSKGKVDANPDSDPVEGAGAGAIEDMVRCPACGAYRASGLQACSTSGCTGKA
jgi:hypothetical protein